MDDSLVENVRTNLDKKRQNLTAWLEDAPSHKRAVRLGPAAEGDVHAHLEVLNGTLVRTADQTFGQCTVCHDYVDAALLQMDYTASVCLDHFSTDEKRELESQLELSQVVQRALLPQHAPHIPGLEVALFSRPAQILGGDCIDFSPFRTGAYGLAIADVADHGIAASLLMVTVQTALRTLVPQSDSPADVVNQLNRFFSHNIHFTTFVTLFLAHFEPATRTLTYSNAGHNPPLVIRRQDVGQPSISWLRPTGAAIGLIEEFQATAKAITLAPGDMLLLYTDGVTEAVNAHKEQFGDDRLAVFAQQRSHLPVGELVQALRQELDEFTGSLPLPDDTTIVAGKVTGLE